MGLPNPSGRVINWSRGHGHYHSADSRLSQIPGFRKSNKTCVGCICLKARQFLESDVTVFTCTFVLSSVTIEFGNRIFKQFIWIKVFLRFWKTNSKKAKTMMLSSLKHSGSWVFSCLENYSLPLHLKSNRDLGGELTWFYVDVAYAS